MKTNAKAGRYELLEELGSGAMGVVYRAYDPVIGRTVAVKTMRLGGQGSGMSHAELFSRFQTEARAAGRLAHPNIVVVHDAGEEDDWFYITMELIEGRSLESQIAARQAFPIPRVLRVMQQACAALDYAHQRSVVHRDIKPANLMLMPDDTLKITDFGTAKILALGNEQTVQIIGTPSYMSPEQIKGRPLDGRSDVFSLGVVLYELVTGEKPFAGENVTTVIYKIVNEEPLPPCEIDSSIHPGLSAVIQGALAKSPSLRFRSCAEFFEALQNYRSAGAHSAAGPPVLADEPKRAYPPVRRANSLPARGVVAPAQTSGRHRTSIWLALVLLAVIAGAGYHLWPQLHGIWQRDEGAAAVRETGRVPALPAASSPQVGGFSTGSPAIHVSASSSPAGR